MMLYGKRIKLPGVLLLAVLFLTFSCCNKKNIEKQKSTTAEETKQQVAVTNKTKSEKTNTTEKEMTSRRKTEIITTVADNSGDNAIVFDVTEEKESINISTRTTATSTSDYISNEPTSQQSQVLNEPATDSDGWVTKWY